MRRAGRARRSFWDPPRSRHPRGRERASFARAGRVSRKSRRCEGAKGAKEFLRSVVLAPFQGPRPRCFVRTGSTCAAEDREGAKARRREGISWDPSRSSHPEVEIACSPSDRIHLMSEARRRRTGLSRCASGELVLSTPGFKRARSPPKDPSRPSRLRPFAISGTHILPVRTDLRDLRRTFAISDLRGSIDHSDRSRDRVVRRISACSHSDQAWHRGC